MLANSHNTHITNPDGSKALTTHIGTLKLNDHITLKNVLYVPEFQFNLIYVLRIYADMSCVMKFTYDSCLLLTTPILLVIDLSFRKYISKFHNGLCYGDIQSPGSHSSISNVTVDVHITSACGVVDNNAKLWHLRMGHLPFSQHKHVFA